MAMASTANRDRDPHEDAQRIAQRMEIAPHEHAMALAKEIELKDLELAILERTAAKQVTAQYRENRKLLATIDGYTEKARLDREILAQHQALAELVAQTVAAEKDLEIIGLQMDMQRVEEERDAALKKLEKYESAVDRIRNGLVRLFEALRCGQCRLC